MPFRQPLLRGMSLAVLLFCGVLVLSACSTSMPMSTVDSQGNHAQNIQNLLFPLLWAGLGVFIVVEGILIYSVIRYRRKQNAGIPAQVHGNMRVEVLWTVAPALIVLVIAILTFQTQRINADLVYIEDALQIKATGYQWWFEFEYPDQGIETATDMYIPVGRDIVVELHAEDVMHNFWVPKLAGKTYMIPNNVNRTGFRADEPGIYRGQCAEFCGESHAQMGFRIIAVSQEAFDQWLAVKQTPPTIPAGDPQAGIEVFNGRGCIGCHVVDGNDRAVGQHGPNLTYYKDRTTVASGTLPNTEENLAAWLRNSEAIKPGNLMSNAIGEGALSEEEIANLIAYLYSMETSVELPEVR
ncbi:MAG: hypothetical protein GFH27_549301n226 [Chloroflexi bacterium AL-W]|nr:hypothetical protein [Chloroflexi bacterium AL-N1]NOK68420.1 hypothetical protein [Chloroflexi bacterium AL-N10]NOK74066.1 hypothetical protein [Chloroflexi bacterium AL-N5]NOK83033.1 hypothetical protein [Chloroflexi bacterium AL-W]NOK90556.1 hypothetical protein [Chloroflexi bacterium AL-N15]